MTRWTPDQLSAYQARRELQQGQADDKPDPGSESTLQAKITKWAKTNGFPILSLRQSIKARGFITPGWPDIVLILKDRVLFIELKAGKKGRPSNSQLRMRAEFKFLGFPIHEVRSFKKFLEVVSA